MFARIIRGVIREKMRSTAPMRNDHRPRAAVIFGVGATPGIGAAVAQRVADAGMPVFLAGRDAAKLEATVAGIHSDTAVRFQLFDAADPASIQAVFAAVDSAGFTPGLVVHNIGSNRPAPLLEINPEELEASWRSDCLSALYIGQEAVRRMRVNAVADNGGQGTIIFTGATASLRGAVGFAAFASNKAGLRSMAQAMAREFGPQGIHVAHVVIDGMVDGDRLRQAQPEWLKQKGPGETLDPAAIADTYWRIANQQRSAWTHELDLRPASEPW